MPADNPKRSDPHMRIAHSVWEAICRAEMTSLDIQVFLLVLRKSWGFNKKTVCISSEMIGEELGKDPGNVRRTLIRLVGFNMLEITERARRNKPTTYMPNKFFWTWTNLREKLARQSDTLSASPMTRQMCGIDAPFEKSDPDLSHTPSSRSGDRPKSPKETFKETFKETPQPHRGDGGGSDSVSDLPSEEIEAAKKALFKLTGVFPNSKDYLRVRSVTRSPLPPNWHPDKWHDHCRAVTTELLRKVATEHREGKAIGCVYAVACTRAKKQLLTDALNPEKYEDEYDESA